MTLSVEDRLEINELYARYCHYFDSGKADEWAALFTPDGFFVRQGNADTGVEAMERRGRASLAAFVRQRFEESNGGMRHFVSNIALEATATGAIGTAYVVVLTLCAGEPPKVTRLGRYRDELAKSSDGWLFRGRVFTPDF